MSIRDAYMRQQRATRGGSPLDALFPQQDGFTPTEPGDPNFGLSTTPSSQAQFPAAAAEQRIYQNRTQAENVLQQAQTAGINTLLPQYDPIRQVAETGFKERALTIGEGLINFIDGGREAVNLLFQDVLGGRAEEGYRDPTLGDYFDALWFGIKDQDGFTEATGLNPDSGSYTLDMLGWEPAESLPGKVARGVATFGLEVAFDPLTYVTFGLSGLGKGAAMAASRKFGDDVAKAIMPHVRQGTLTTAIDGMTSPYMRKVARNIDQITDDFMRDHLTKLDDDRLQALWRWLTKNVDETIDPNDHYKIIELARENATELAIYNKVRDDVMAPLLRRDFAKLDTDALHDLPAYAYGGARISLPFSERMLRQGVVIPGTQGLGKKLVGDPIREISKKLGQHSGTYRKLAKKLNDVADNVWKDRSLMAGLARESGGIEGWQFHIMSSSIDNLSNRHVLEVTKGHLNARKERIVELARGAKPAHMDEDEWLDAVWGDVFQRLEGQGATNMLTENILQPATANRLTLEGDLDREVQGLADELRDTFDSYHAALGKFDKSAVKQYVEGYAPHQVRTEVSALLGELAGKGGTQDRKAIMAAQDRGDMGGVLMAQLLNAIGKGGRLEDQLGATRHLNHRELGRLEALTLTDNGAILFDQDFLRGLKGDTVDVLSESGEVAQGALQTKFLTVREMNEALAPVLEDLAAKYDVTLPKGWDGKIFNDNPLDVASSYIENLDETIRQWNYVESMYSAGLAVRHGAAPDSQAMLQKIYANTLRNTRKVVAGGGPTLADDVVPVSFLEGMVDPMDYGKALDRQAGMSVDELIEKYDLESPREAFPVLKEGKMTDEGFQRGTRAESWEAFVADVKKNGIKDPIRVGFDGQGNHIIINGHNRLLAAKEAGIENVPVKFSRMDVDVDDIAAAHGQNLRGYVNDDLLDAPQRTGRLTEDNAAENMMESVWEVFNGGAAEDAFAYADELGKMLDDPSIARDIKVAFNTEDRALLDEVTRRVEAASARLGGEGTGFRAVYEEYTANPQAFAFHGTNRVDEATLDAMVAGEIPFDRGGLAATPARGEDYAAEVRPISGSQQAAAGEEVVLVFRRTDLPDRAQNALRKGEDVEELFPTGDPTLADDIFPVAYYKKSEGIESLAEVADDAPTGGGGIGLGGDAARDLKQGEVYKKVPWKRTPKTKKRVLSGFDDAAERSATKPGRVLDLQDEMVAGRMGAQNVDDLREGAVAITDPDLGEAAARDFDELMQPEPGAFDEADEFMFEGNRTDPVKLRDDSTSEVWSASHTLDNGTKVKRYEWNDAKGKYPTAQVTIYRNADGLVTSVEAVAMDPRAREEVLDILMDELPLNGQFGKDFNAFARGQGGEALQSMDPRTAGMVYEAMLQKVSALPDAAKEALANAPAEIVDFRARFETFQNTLNQFLKDYGAHWNDETGELFLGTTKLAGDDEFARRVTGLRAAAKELKDEDGFEAAMKIFEGVDEFMGLADRPGFVNPRMFALGGPALESAVVQADMLKFTRQLARNAATIYTPEGVAALKLATNSVLQWWKAMATIARPGFHIRNLVGGVWNGMIAGVGPKHYKAVSFHARNIRKAVLNEGLDFDVAIRKVIKDPREQKIWIAAWENDVLSGFVSTEFRNLTGAQKKSRMSWANIFDIEQFGLTRMGGHFMESIEDFMRMSTFRAWYDPDFPGSAAVARDMVRTVHFDYSNLTPFESKIKQFVPFFVWTKNNVALQARQFIENPRMIQRYRAMMNSMDDQFQDSGYPNPENMSAFAFDTGYKVNAGTPFWARVMIDPDLPVRDFLELPYPTPPELLNYAGDLLGPHIGGLADLNNQRDFGPVNAPAPINGVLKALAAVGLFDTTTDGDVRIPYWSRTLMETAVPFARDVVEPAFGGPTDPNRQARTGIGQEAGGLESIAKSFAGPLQRAVGVQYSPPSDIRASAAQSNQAIDALVEQMRLSGQLPPAPQQGGGQSPLGALFPGG